MVKVSDMSDEARRYYEGGKRIMIDGLPCRVAAWARTTPGKATIAALAKSGGAVAAGDLPEAPAFSFTPVEREASNAKPSNRSGFSYRSRFKSASGWRPAGLSYKPYEARELTDTPAALEKAKREYQKGNPKLLREYLAGTAGERRAYWARVDAERAAEAAAGWRLAA